MALIPVILAGGTGSRLWPVSRELRPKQFLRLFSERSLFQETLLRAQQVSAAPPIILGSEEHRFVIAEQCREIGVQWQHIVLEPAVRSTAPAIALAALLAQDDGDHELLILSSDHIVEDVAAFAEAVSRAEDAARDEQLVTFGIAPTGPETGYGYIRAARADAEALPVEAFVEKPDAQTATRYLEEGGYYWNSGMFLFKAQTYLQALERFAADVYRCASAAMAAAVRDLDFCRPGVAFADSPSISIDYAVMEHAANVMVVPSAFGWSDVGSWDSVRQVLPRDDHGNATYGDVLTVDTTDSLVRSEHRLIATLGISNTVVIETSDVVLVADERYVQQVKSIVSELQARGRSEHRAHRRVFRPWGSYESLESASRFQVKRISVSPEASISLQKHHHRAEHWIVVRGTAEVTRDDETYLVTENESTYIPVGTVHRLRNPGKVPLELIEVQVGSYLGEDDIVRFEDVYGRT
jgi:mannose-1-phosphate guanylyltransferase/mannose-6-phosphate isomerase